VKNDNNNNNMSDQKRTMKSRISSNKVLIALGVVAAAMLAMVVAIGVTKLGGDSSGGGSSDASQADVGKGGQVFGFNDMPTQMPTPMPTVLPGNPTQTPTAPQMTTNGVVPAPAPRPTTSGSVALTYKPGDLSEKENGISLSTGLLITLIAQSDRRVDYADGERSDLGFEQDPAGGTTFPDGEGWIYVMDFDRGNDRGGVGALTFNAEGAVTNYQMLLEDTNENRNGDSTPWGTYLSCENVDGDGSIFEVDPKGEVRASRTLLGSAAGRASWSGVAYDDRRSNSPVFYASADGREGASFAIRYKPSQNAINTHLFSNPAFTLLQEDASPTVEFLVLVPTPEEPRKGVFTWINDEDLGRDSSQTYFDNISNIEVYDGILYMLSEDRKELFTLDLDSEEYTSESTEMDNFEGDPFSVKHVLQHNGRRRQRRSLMQRLLHAGHPHGSIRDIPSDLPLLYFAEGNDDKAGIYARNEDGQYVTILEDQRERGDIAALAFSPNLKNMYFALKGSGEVFMVEREDGHGFDSAALEMSFIS